MRLLWILTLTLAAIWVFSAFMAPPHSVEALAHFSREHLDRADARAQRGYLASGAGAFISFGLLWYLSKRSFLGGKGPFSGRVSLGRSMLMAAALGALVTAIIALVMLPVRAYSGYFLERQYGLTGASFGVWLVDYLKDFLLGAFGYAVAGAAVAWMLQKIPRGWIWTLTVGSVVASAFIAFIYPSVIAPFMDRFHPLEDPVILADIERLSADAGMEIGEVLVMEASAKTTRSNAYFAGFGKARQVVLYDNLIDTHTPEQVKLVLAHEMGHWKYGHVAKGILISAVGTLLVLLIFRTAIADIPLTSYRNIERALLALLLVSSLAGYVLSPASSYISRRFEVEADAFSLALTGDSDTFVSTQVNLAVTNLSDVDPPAFMRWFAWTHPTTLERIRVAERWNLPSP